ncbi:MAG: universal stress protein [Elusimicrobiota bacterium]
MLKRILAAVDGSEYALRAAGFAAELARQAGAELMVIVVDDGKPLASALVKLQNVERLSRAEIFDRILENAVKRCSSTAGANVRTILAKGDPAEKVLAAADAEASDLIVAGARGLGPLRQLLLGSVSSKLIQLSGRPCLIVPPPGRSRQKAAGANERQGADPRTAIR